MGWVYLLGLGVSGVLYALNALAPRKRPPVVFLWSFFASWITIELVWHHLVFGAVLTAVLVGGGAVDDPAGIVGLVLMGITGVLFVTIGLTTRRTVVSMQGALADLEPGADAPRFPRSHVVLPFLLNRRKGVRHTRHIEFARVGGKRLRLDVTIPSAPVPAGRTLRPALMQIHGGGWVIGDKREQGLPLLNHMAAQGWVGFNVNYRLSPGVAMPEHLIDLKRGLAWIREHAEEYGIDPELHLRHRRLGRRAPHGAHGAHGERAAGTSLGSRPPTRAWRRRCPSTASTTSPTPACSAATRRCSRSSSSPS